MYDLLTSLRFQWVCLTAVVLLVAGLFYGGAQPVAVGLLQAPWDKVVHAALFALLALLIALSRPAPSLTWLVFSLLSATCVGALDEVHQYFLPGRSADWADLIADVLGAGLGVTVAAFLNTRQSPLQGPVEKP